MDRSLTTKLYRKRPDCLHLESYQILIRSTQAVVCGPCFFRDGYETEVPTRINTRIGDGNFGAPAIDPLLIDHAMVSVGLVPPLPGQSLREFRAKRRGRSQPSQKRHPITTALWELMGVQPPLAKVLVRFCDGLTEVDIARESDRSLLNVVETLRKSVHTAQPFLRV